MSFMTARRWVNSAEWICAWWDFLCFQEAISLCTLPITTVAVPCLNAIVSDKPLKQTTNKNKLGGLIYIMVRHIMNSISYCSSAIRCGIVLMVCSIVSDSCFNSFNFRSSSLIRFEISSYLNATTLRLSY